MRAAWWHLDRFIAAISRRGWRADPRYEVVPPVVVVRHPDFPVFDESVIVTPSADNRLWFQAMGGRRWLAPVENPGTAADQLIAHMSPISDAIEAPARPPRWRRWFGIRGAAMPRHRR